MAQHICCSSGSSIRNNGFPRRSSNYPRRRLYKRTAYSCSPICWVRWIWLFACIWGSHKVCCCSQVARCEGICTAGMPRIKVIGHSFSSCHIWLHSSIRYRIRLHPSPYHRPSPVCCCCSVVTGTFDLCLPRLTTHIRASTSCNAWLHSVCLPASSRICCCPQTVLHISLIAAH